MDEKLRIAFIHPDLGIGGAERLVVDAALGLQRLGHFVDIYTSHHDPGHCFIETRDGTLRVHHIRSPFPRSFKGKLHIVFAHLRQLHLTAHLLRTNASDYDVYFVDQLSTCIPFLRAFAKKRVVFYCHFPDKLLSDGEVVGGMVRRRRTGLLKRVYRMPMDLLEEKTTAQADVLLANSEFTAGVFDAFFSIPRTPLVVYPGIDITAYAPPSDMLDPDVQVVTSDRPTLLSLNRFERKKNAALAIKAFAILRQNTEDVVALRLVLAGGYDHRLQDNIETLSELVQLAQSERLRFWISTPLSAAPAPSDLPPATAPSTAAADVLFLLNFTTPQRAALLTARTTRALLYTPAAEHFGIVPVEGMACGLPVLACDSGGPAESVLAAPPSARTGWLVPPAPDAWATALGEILGMSEAERKSLGARARERAEAHFGMEAMAHGLEDALYEAVAMGPVASASLASDVLLAVFISLLAYLTYRLIV